MVLLPSNQKEFADPLYWKKFFEKCDTAFEWYGEYSVLAPILENYIKPTCKILQLGCGNSNLAEQLYDNGFRNITSIDIDAKVIQKQAKKNENRSELVFKTASVTETGFEDAEFNTVLDKGTLDALLPPGADTDAEKVVTDMFNEIDRVLSVLGRYICVTLAQDHVVNKLMEHFHASQRFLVRVHRTETDRHFSMPVFVFVFTKLKNQMKTAIDYVSQLPPYQRIERCEGIDGLMNNLRSERELAWLYHQTSRCLREEVSLVLNDLNGNPRYTFTILDDPNLTTLLTYGVFVAPVGHETDWLFSTPKGRATLRKQCNRHRLLLVRLMPNQVYLSINHIEIEITDLSTKLAPPYFGQKSIEFLSLGRMESMEVVASGESPVNGKWTVEHVKGGEDKVYRRLIFLNSSSLIQSEVEMIPGKNKLRMNDDYLSCDHHRSMITSLQFLAGDLESAIAKSENYRFCVLGLGGGLLAKFLHKKLPKCHVVGVEYDKAVVKIAKGQFGLPTDERMEVRVCDAYEYMQEVSEKPDEEKFDVVFMDLATSESDVDGLACPPSKFATPEAIELAKKCLKPTGVFSMNLVTRDDEIVNRVKNDTLKVFPHAHVINEEEDVNEVLVCPLKYDKSALKKSPKDQSERWQVSYSQMLQKLQPVDQKNKK
ncbi:unnamed protein product [Bursaphelenchus xylophilus]|uniref:(pine wood nematode) hypothetical protein n=1 Tax=Bursaphelenchus xylophilus TaxID=6326 RepID=A0A1I7SDG5_BURXY|nr:unnamed protein product [Bursaphelenchus xylophilus]CAG9131690.1 unnamed protein product [Bursaphelenchus xylophilus]